MTDARETIQKAASKFEDLPHGRRYGLYDYSGYEGEAPPHVVLSPDGETVYRSNDRDAASAEYDRLSRLHRADFILAALTSSGFRILGPAEIDQLCEDIQVAVSSMTGDCKAHHKIALNHMDRAIRALAKENLNAPE